MENNGKGLCVASMVLGIIACVLCWFGYAAIASLILGIVGIILASMGRKKAKLVGAPTGMGTAGMVLCIIATVLSGIVFVSCTLCVACAGSAASSGLW